MNSEIRMSVSTMTRTKDSKAVYVLFEDGGKKAEFALPELRLVSSEGFSEEEISQLRDYAENEKDSIMEVARKINPMRALMDI
ncbi:MAG: hypothetical protein K6G58_02435 [Lachnospiraceae bacterium]|nr:hypothetical protein [Lachnospiraceae bacterium]